MPLICKILGHKYIKHGDGIEKPYLGNYRENDKTPHSRYLSFVYCSRCGDLKTLNNYFFDYGMEIEK